MSKQCPHCNLTNPPDAIRCDCGHDFIAGKMPESVLQAKRKFPWAIIVAFVLAILGDIWSFFEIRSEMLSIPEGEAVHFSLTPGVAFALAGITFVATLPFAVRGILIEKRRILGVLAIGVALLSLPLSFYIVERAASERHLKWGE